MENIKPILFRNLSICFFVSIVQGMIMINLHNDIADFLLRFRSFTFFATDPTEMFMQQFHGASVFVIYFQCNLIFIWKEERKLKVIMSYIFPIAALLPGAVTALPFYFNSSQKPYGYTPFGQYSLNAYIWVSLCSFIYLILFHLVKWHFEKKKQSLLAD
jgi:hypothetical protein